MSIIRLAKEVSKERGMLILGQPSSGKTRLAIKKVGEQKPLWISFTNMNGLDVKVAEDWDVAQPSSWDEFNNQIVTPMSQGKFNDYDVVVIDGLHILSQLCLHYVASKRSGESEIPVVIQGDYLNMGKLVQGALVKLRGSAGQIVVICDVVPDEAGNDQVALNRDLFNRIVGLFADKLFTYTTPEQIKHKNTGVILYEVETTGASAIRLMPKAK